MKILYLDCFSGISGDMTLGALLDLGLNKDLFLQELQKLHLEGYQIKFERAVKNGIAAEYVRVMLAEESHHHEEHEHTHSHSHTHDGDHDHSHHHHHETREQSQGDSSMHPAAGHGESHTHSHHRNLKDIEAIIDNSGITERARILAKNIFMRVAQAEAKVHNSTPYEVHFHEVGAVDSIVDIVGAAILVDMLDPDAIYASVINDGSGFTYCQHGMIPVPVPAVMEIFGAGKVPFKQIDIDKELVTPTGAAIVAELAQGFGPMPEMRILKTGYGAGTRNNKIPNVVRAVLGEVSDGADDTVTLLETNIDDTTGELMGYVMDKLLAKGALDVFFTPIYMKKNRPAYKLTVLCKEAHRAALEEILFKETSTLGIRRRVENRSVMARTFLKMDTEYGPITVKKAIGPEIEKYSFEYEELKRIARERNIPLVQVYKQLEKALK